MISDFKLLLKNRKFVELWTSQILSQVSINLMNFLLLISLFAKTRSTIATSFLWIAYALPALFVGPIASAVVDLTDRRKVLMITNFLQALTIFVYAFLRHQKPFLAYGIAFIYSFLNQFYVPAESATLPSVVSKDQLTHANSLFFLTQQSSLVIGFGFAGILNHLLGFKSTLILCAIFLFAAFISVTFLPSSKPKSGIPEELEAALKKFFRTMVDGYQFIKKDRYIWAPFMLLVGLQVALAIGTVSIPAIATDVLGINPNLIGPVVVVPAAIGAALISIFLPKLYKIGWRKKKVIEISLVAISLSFILMTFIVPLLPYSGRVLGSVISTFIIGVGFVGVTIPSQTFLQQLTPKELQGRVFGNFWFIVTVLTILPVVFSGAIAEILGTQTLLVVLFGFCVFALYVSRRFEKLDANTI